MIWLYVALGLVAASAVAQYLYTRLRKKKPAAAESRLISFVALMKEPAAFDPVVVAKVVEKAWKVDLGGGAGEGTDGFVVGTGPLIMIRCQDQMYMVNQFDRPYVDNPEAASQEIADLRLRNLFAEHKAWFSIDAMGVDAGTPKEEILSHFRKMGPVFADLLDERCLAIFVPDQNLGFALNDETDQALRSDDPLAALRDALAAPIVAIAPDDPRMLAAVAKARQEWPRFVAAFEHKQGENFAIKAPVRHGDEVEFIWIQVTATEGDRVYGTLGNDPANLGPMRFGSKVSVSASELNDWIFIDGQQKPQGGFTIAVLTQAGQRKQPKT